jgi:iron(III) transport system ATP-binding protein
MTRITVDRISKRFDRQAVLQDLSLVVEDGSFFTLLGPSGCGKTTLLRCIAGFNDADAGRILFDDDDITAVPAHQRNIGMVFQDYALFPDKSVFDNVAYGLRARKLAREEVHARAQQALEQVGLQPLGARLPAQLSGGQRQRVALARALVIKPRVLLMDEPLSNLDAKLRLSMRDVILDLQRATRITTVFVTHDQEEALALSDQIAVMQAGRVAQQGTPQSLYATPRAAYVADFIGSANLLPVTVAAAGRVNLGDVGLQVDTGAIPVAAAGQLVLRPEALRMMRVGEAAAGATANLLPARVARRQYLGAKTSYRLTLSGGHELQVEDAGMASYEVGEAVQLRVPADSRVVAA